MNAANNEHITVGLLIAPHGINGTISADCLSDNPLRFHAGAVFTLDRPVQGRAELTLESASTHKGRLLLKFAGIDDRNAAETLRGRSLLVARADIPPLSEGVFYHFQILGLQVWEEDREIGRIVDILDYTANDIYVVEQADGSQRLIPALRSVVQSIDLTTGRMQVRLPEGL